MKNTLELEDGSHVLLDEHGHLVNREEWSAAVAEGLAARDRIVLTETHWLVIRVLREYYEEYGIEPPMRALVRILRDKGAGESATSLELYRLFPEGPAKQGSRYSGLPIPLSCI